jgi:hypothetical protein
MLRQKTFNTATKITAESRRHEESRKKSNLNHKGHEGNTREEEKLKGRREISQIVVTNRGIPVK